MWFLRRCRERATVEELSEPSAGAVSPAFLPNFITILADLLSVYDRFYLAREYIFFVERLFIWWA